MLLQGVEDLASDEPLQATHDVALGKPLGSTSLHVELDVRIGANSRDGDQVQRLVRLAIPSSMQPHPIGLARGDWDPCDTTEPREGPVVQELLHILRRRDEQLGRMLGADAAAREQRWSTLRDYLREVHVHLLHLLIE